MGQTASRAPLKASYDAVIVGAGFAGMYQLYRLRNMGLSCVVIEAGDGVGGTWYWNRYPGARCDVTSVEYSYSWSRELEQEWEWTELMASQPEIERYLNHVVDRFDLRRDVVFQTRVTAAHYNEAANRWTFATDRGDELTATYAIMATGCLSMPLMPDYPGIDTFRGVSVQTSLWPKEGVELEGKRVAVIGTGSSAVQAIPEIGRVAREMTVFQRTPAYTWPSPNRPLTAEDQATVKANYDALRERQRNSVVGISGSFTGALVEPPTKKLLETPEEVLQAPRNPVHVLLDGNHHVAQHGGGAGIRWRGRAYPSDGGGRRLPGGLQRIDRHVREPGGGSDFGVSQWRALPDGPGGRGGPGVPVRPGGALVRARVATPFPVS